MRLQSIFFFRLKRLRPLDFLFFFASAAVSVYSAVFVYAGGTDAERIRISGRDRDWLYPLNAVETVRAAGPLGDTVIEIGGGEARIVSSPCRNQICVAAPPIHRRGQWIVCLPNQVMARVENPSASAGPDVDAAVW